MFAESPKRDPFGDTFATLEDEVELDPEQTKLLLAALRQHHTSHIAAFQKTVAGTRSVYSKRLKREVFATSWRQLKLDVKEGPLPPTPPRTPTPSPPSAQLVDDTDSSSAESDRLPVIYNLHGAGGNEFHSYYDVKTLHEGIVEGRWPPAIVVLPNGGTCEIKRWLAVFAVATAF